MSDLERFEIAVAVFATVPGVDDRDAANRMEAAITQMIHRGTGRSMTLLDPQLGLPMPVHGVLEVGRAVRGGSLTLTPTDIPKRGWLQ